MTREEREHPLAAGHLHILLVLHGLQSQHLHLAQLRFLDVDQSRTVLHGDDADADDASPPHAARDIGERGDVIAHLLDGLSRVRQQLHVRVAVAANRLARRPLLVDVLPAADAPRWSHATPTPSSATVRTYCSFLNISRVVGSTSFTYIVCATVLRRTTHHTTDTLSSRASDATDRRL
jgi:hypothetical protein